jgi:putative ABC transport system permease protein
MAKRWLEEFRYRIELTWDVFVATGLVAIVIALITVSYQSVKAGLVKPVNNLRSE